MKLEMMKGEDAIDKLADILVPLTNIINDTEIRKQFNTENRKVIELVQYILKNHKKDIVEVMAVLDGTTPDKYKCNVLTLPKELIELLNDKEVNELFTSYVASMVPTAFGSATENTQETEAE